MSAEDAELMAAATPEDFSFRGWRFRARVDSVYDGDTIRITFKYGGEYVRWPARMLGYNSDEVRPPAATPNRAAVVAAAHAQRDALAAVVYGRCVDVECGDFDKYGRILVTVTAPVVAGGAPESVNAWMVRSGLGVPYDGGAKHAVTNY